MTHHLIPALLLILISQTTIAASPDIISEENYFDEIPLVLSVTRLTQSIADTPASVTVIDRDMIDASGIREIVEIFKLVPGMMVGFINGNRQTVSYHGLTDQYSRDMQVLIDGRSVYTAALGGVDWANLPLTLDDVEKIEVIRGPNAASYGSNSFSAVISITTRHPQDQQGNWLKTTFSNVGARDMAFRHADSAGPLDYRVTAEFRSDDGFKRRYDSKVTRLLSSRFDYQATPQDKFTLQAGYSEGYRQDGFYQDAEQPKQTRDMQRDFQQLRWEHEWDENQVSSVQFYRTYQKKLETVGDNLPLGGGLFITQQDNSSITDRQDLEAQHTIQFNNSLRGVFGTSFRKERLKSPFYLGTDKYFHINLKRFFTNIEYRIFKPLVINAGAMYEDNDITGKDVSPRIAFNLNLDERNTLRAVFSQAKRTPVKIENNANVILKTFPLPLSAFGLNSQLFQTPQPLNPESIISREIGYNVRFKNIPLTADIKIFQEVLTDLIATEEISVPGINLRLLRNRNQIDINGFELSLEWLPTRKSRLHFNYTQLDSFSDSPDAARLIESTPKHIMSFLFMHEFEHNLKGSLSYYWISDHRWLGEGTRIKDTLPFEPDIRRLDASLASKINIGDKDLIVRGTVQNLLGNYHDFYRSYNDKEKQNLFNTRVLLTVEINL